MRIVPNNGAPEVSGVPSSTARKPLRLEQDHVSLTSADTLSEALATTPPVRAEQVERARQLVLDASYPPEVLINKISALFAGHLGPKDPTQDEDANPASEAAQ